MMYRMCSEQKSFSLRCCCFGLTVSIPMLLIGCAILYWDADKKVRFRKRYEGEDAR